MTTNSKTNSDNFDNFDIDNIDGDMLDDLLKDDLDPDVEPASFNIPSNPPKFAAIGSSSWQQPKPPQLKAQQPRQNQPASKPSYQTITSMFSKRVNSTTLNKVPQKRPAPTRTSIDSAPTFPPPPPAQPSKMRKLDDPQIQEIVDLIDLEDDYVDFVSENAVDKPKHQQQPQQHAFKAKEIIIRNRGDNTLVESTHVMDRDAMRSYMYPLIDGQPARAYQQGAIQRCIFQNTLVALPTGMGKTLIAVVVMANYARWFPNSLAIFLAPTRPLVAQQTQACSGMLRAILSKVDETNQSNDVSSPRFGRNWIVEMNGSTPPKSREVLWNDARFVFSTPQVLQNDLSAGTLSLSNAKRISLIVIDEAHRATGKYAYGESISKLYMLHHGHEAPIFNPLQPAPPIPFRVMALTATPGSNIDAVREIINRLHIAHIFLRTEESLDVVPYIHGRRIEEIGIDLPPWLLAARDCLATVMRRSINILCNTCHAMQDPGELKRLSGYQLRLDRDRFFARQRGSSTNMNATRISSEFTVAISLAHIMQLLSEHGLRPAWRAIRSWDSEASHAKEKKGTASYAKIDCASSKEWTDLMCEFGALIDLLDGKQPSVSYSTGTVNGNASSPRGNTAKGAAANSTQTRTDVVSSYFNIVSKQSIAGNSAKAAMSHQPIYSLTHPGFLGHPKLEKLVQIVKEHFETAVGTNDSESTRIIVFSQYRGSVSEIVDVLRNVSPLIKCEQFIGQSNTSNNRSSSNGTNSSSRGGRGGRDGRAGRGWSRGRGWGRPSYGGSGGGGANRNYAPTGGSQVAGISDSEDTLLEGLDAGSSDMRGQTQKEQLAVMNRFRNGQTNVIVATCVGEEGLDIGEVDLIINYDAPSSPIRLLQRIGRTGRARRGKVVVFLAKDTREENSYKRAQRDYKSVQAKIASGKGIDLRADLSPPMLLPTLPPGLPARNEVVILREEISRGDPADGVSGRSKTASGSRKKGAAPGRPLSTEGIDTGDIYQFRQLAEKYRCPSSCATSAGSEQQTVARLLMRGIAWQSSVSPHCLIPHSHRSTVYRSLMADLENARFNSQGITTEMELTGNNDHNCIPKLSIPTIASSSCSSMDLVSTERPQKCGERNCISDQMYLQKSKEVGSTSNNAPFAIGSGSRSDYCADELEDVNTILSKPSKESSPQSLTGFRSAGTNRSLNAHETSYMVYADRTSKDNRQSNSAKSSGISRKPGSPSAKTDATHQRRPSSQMDLFDTIEKLVKSGKAKLAFDWNLALDGKLLEMAKAQRIELEITALPAENTNALATARSGISTSVFGDIGQPGAFDKLYDESIDSTTLDDSKRTEERLIGKDKCTIYADARIEESQVLCPESDAEEGINASTALDDMEAWALSSLDGLQVSTPPTQPVPKSPPTLQAMSNAANSAETVRTGTNTTVIAAAGIVLGDDPFAGVEMIISDDSDFDKQLQSFDIDSTDIMILSDDDAVVNTPERSDARQTRKDAKLFLNSTPPSSSPLPFLRKRAICSSDTLSDANDAATIDGFDSSLKSKENNTLISPSPVNRRLKRLVRRKGDNNMCEPARSSIEAAKATIEHSSIESIVYSEQIQKHKATRRRLRPPPKRTRNMFVDDEAGIGDSDDERGMQRDRKGRNNPEVSGDESDGEDLDRDLSSFVVDDEHVDFDSPSVSSRHTDRDGMTVNSNYETPKRHDSRDIYRQSLLSSPTTPVSELMRRLAEREKQRRWVSDTPTRLSELAASSPLVLCASNGSDIGSSDDGDEDNDDDDDIQHSSTLSDFENVEDMFTQAR
ncbi:3'-5' DNA helicase [Coemansia spiralis]|uniref:DNA helicase n=2 Tax=Coemansia TaxID=4863 RepID=A0A9W8GBW1_9FUNG|nr:3'-5' DNA helicase [Coemansia umbellata]KAJ2623579.1 3'-5' DNA helicase [Coemansia sp. RSA 1358]KAJ2680249.1 3'-5' DNA helicase [Coemansia spiralis]